MASVSPQTVTTDRTNQKQINKSVWADSISFMGLHQEDGIWVHHRKPSTSCIVCLFIIMTRKIIIIDMENIHLFIHFGKLAISPPEIVCINHKMHMSFYCYLLSKRMGFFVLAIFQFHGHITNWKAHPLMQQQQQHQQLCTISNNHKYSIKIGDHLFYDFILSILRNDRNFQKWNCGRLNQQRLTNKINGFLCKYTSTTHYGELGDG